MYGMIMMNLPLCCELKEIIGDVHSWEILSVKLDEVVDPRWMMSE
jgi:hypothetical protein